MNRQGKIDRITLIIYILLVTIGWLAVYSADFNINKGASSWIHYSYNRQIIWIGLGLALAFLIRLLDTRFFTSFAYAIYAFWLLMLIYTLLFGAEIAGATSWIRFGIFSIQPSEFAKFATCLGLAKYLSSFDANLQNFNQQLVAGAIILVPLALILQQNDTGSALVYTSLVLLLYREGLSGGFLLIGALAVILFLGSLLLPTEWVTLSIMFLVFLFLVYRKGLISQSAMVFLLPISSLIAAVYFLQLDEQIILGILGASAIIFLLFFLFTKHLVYLLLTLTFACSIYVSGVDYIFNNVLKPHQQARIGVILGTIEDNRGAGYNLNQSKIAIGSGGLWGKGFLNGTQNKGSFVPESNTDFIFCSVGEEFGFIGSAVVVLLFLALLLRLTHIAERQKSTFSRIYGYGVASIIFFHVTINIGMTIGLMPVIGIPLPFISYGGSALWGFTILLFVMLKLDSERMLHLR